VALSLFRKRLLSIKPERQQTLVRNTMGRKQEKGQQRKQYKEAFKKVKHGHGGRPIRKKEESALGK